MRMGDGPTVVSTGKRFSILQIEDDPIWNRMIEPIVRELPDLAHYECRESGQSALGVVSEMQPDLILLDLMLPDIDGFVLAPQLQAAAKSARLLLLTIRSDDVALYHANSPSFSGMLWKSVEITNELPLAIRTVLAGGRYFAANVRMSLRRLRSDPQAYFKILSPKEIALLPSLGLGLDDSAVARISGLSVHTVRSHRQHILAKLGMHRSIELVHWCIQHGFVPPPRGSGWVREDS